MDGSVGEGGRKLDWPRDCISASNWVHEEEEEEEEEVRMENFFRFCLKRY
jgi:hypothetical protein